MMGKFLLLLCAVIVFYSCAVHSQYNLGWFYIYSGQEGTPVLDNGLIYPSLPPDREFLAPLDNSQVGDSVTIRPERVERFSTIIQAMDQTIMLCGRPTNNIPGIVNIGAWRFSRGDENYYLLQMHENSVDYRDQRAYWVPEGRSMDIPVHPQNGQPEYVFTPGLSGCSIVVDSIDSNTLRVYHVRAGSDNENSDYNHRPGHGRGMVLALRYSRYGYYIDAAGDDGIPLYQHTMIQNNRGFAYLYYSRSDNLWHIHYQALVSPSMYSNMRPDGMIMMRFAGRSRVLYADSRSIDPNARHFRPVRVRQRIPNPENPNIPPLNPPYRPIHPDLKKK